MQRNVVETVMGAVVLLVAGLFILFFYETTDIKTDTGMALKARFAKIDGLQTGAPVRISGVTVGRVSAFSLDRESYQAVVEMSIDRDIKLPRDTAAIINSDGLMGGKFMSLEPGADEEYLANGDTLEYTQSTPSLEQLLGQVVFSLTDNSDKDKKN